MAYSERFGIEDVIGDYVGEKYRPTPSASAPGSRLARSAVLIGARPREHVSALYGRSLILARGWDEQATEAGRVRRMMVMITHH
jgi:hypothetical protein